VFSLKLAVRITQRKANDLEPKPVREVWVLPGFTPDRSPFDYRKANG